MANSPVRFDPFRELARFDPFGDMDDMLSEFRQMPWRAAEGAPRMRMDLSETDQAYVVKVEIPGVQKDNIKVAIDGNRLTVSAEVQKEDAQTQGTMLRSERYFGQQYRSITLSQEVDDDNAMAKYHDGVLELTLPKKPGTGGKQISIQ